MTLPIHKILFCCLLYLCAFISRSWAIDSKIEQQIDKLPKKFQQQAREVLKKYSDYNQNKTKNSSLYLQTPDGATLAVFSKPGVFNEEECSHDAENRAVSNNKKCKIVSQVTTKTEFKPTGELQFQIKKDIEGKDYLATFMQVSISDTNHKPTVGWLAQDYISFKPITPSFKNILIEKTGQAQKWLKQQWSNLCEQSSTKANLSIFSKAAKKNLTELADVTLNIDEKTLADNKHKENISTIASNLSDKIGQCVLDPPNKAPTKFSSQLVYDQFVLPQITKTKIPNNIIKEDQTPINQKDLIDIDSLARTIYAEMASCVSLGDQYPMAVARIIKNRELAMLENSNFITEFIRKFKEHSVGKSIMCMAATSPVLFTSWNLKLINFEQLNDARQALAKKYQKKMSANKAMAKAVQTIQPNPETNAYYKDNTTGLLHTLCPPSNTDKACYTGGQPDATSSAAWKTILKIATEVVLFPVKFLEKTAELTGIKHYTSDRTSFYDYKKVTGLKIEGKTIDSDKCLNLWVPPSKN